MKGKLINDYNINTNYFSYDKGQIVEVISLNSFPNDYGVYHNLPECNIIDWIPKELVQIK